MTYWRKCSTCKREIGFSTLYWVCSVSTCNRQRTGLIFCSVACCDAHIPMMNHKDAGAIEKRSPTQTEWQRENAPASVAAQTPAREESTPPRRIIPQNQGSLSASPAASSGGPTPLATGVPRETLVVVSKTKDYVRARSGMNTSDGVMDVLSDRIRRLLDEAIRQAGQDGRKTVMDRDFKT